jgi:hypothetical protein
MDGAELEEIASLIVEGTVKHAAKDIRARRCG